MYGDGLSIDKSQRSQKIRRDGGNPMERLELLTPVPADWHARCLLHQVSIYVTQRKYALCPSTIIVTVGIIGDINNGNKPTARVVPRTEENVTKD